MLKSSIKDFCKNTNCEFNMQEVELLRVALRYQSFKL